MVGIKWCIYFSNRLISSEFRLALSWAPRWKWLDYSIQALALTWRTWISYHPPWRGPLIQSNRRKCNRQSAMLSKGKASRCCSFASVTYAYVPDFGFCKFSPLKYCSERFFIDQCLLHAFPSLQKFVSEHSRPVESITLKMVIYSINANDTVLKVSKNDKDIILNNECDLSCVECFEIFLTSMYDKSGLAKFRRCWSHYDSHRGKRCWTTMFHHRGRSNGYSSWKAILRLHYKYKSLAFWSTGVCDSHLGVKCPNMRHTHKRLYAPQGKKHGSDTDIMPKI